MGGAAVREARPAIEGRRRGPDRGRRRRKRKLARRAQPRSRPRKARKAPLALGSCYALGQLRIVEMAVEPEQIRRAHEWLKEVYARQPEREALFTTISGEEVKPLYAPADLAETDA